MRRMIPYNEWVKMKNDLSEVEEEISELQGSASAIVFQRSIPASWWEPISPGSAIYGCTIHLTTTKEIQLNDAIIVSIPETATEAQKNATVSALLSFEYIGDNDIRITVGRNSYVPTISIPINFTVLTPSEMGI